jgi:hypothetical protein
VDNVLVAIRDRRRLATALELIVSVSHCDLP